MEVPNAATEKELKEVVVDIEKEYEPSLMFPLDLEESDPDSLISYVNQLFMRASDGMKQLDGFSFGVKAPKGLQQKGFKSALHPILGLMGCFILHEADLDCFDEGHPQNSHKRWLTDETINFYMLLM